MLSAFGHIEFTGSRKRAVMSEVLAMQCTPACADLLTRETPMSRRNDSFTAIYYYRYC